MKTEFSFSEQNRHVRFLLGAYIRRKRHERGFSISEISSQVEISTQNYKRIEAGRMRINPDLFEKMRVLLSFDTDDLDKIRKIACVRYINELSKVFIPHFPA